MVTTFEDVITTIRAGATPLAEMLNTPHLPEHAPTVALSFLVCFAVQVLVAPLLLKTIAGERYKHARPGARNQWNVRVVALVHALVILPIAFRVLDIPGLDFDRVYGWHPKTGTLSGIACGYFLWDSLESIIHFVDIGFVVHGLACLSIYILSFKPFLAYYGARFLLWELSTPFLNIHWFMDKMGKTGTLMQLVNGLLLLTTFASTRLIYGAFMSYQFYQTLYSNYDNIPTSLIFVFGIGNVVLNGLNWFWFAKMVTALRKRFRPVAVKPGEVMGAGKAN